MKKDIEIFFSYAHEDEQLRDELIKHLSEWKRQGLIRIWHDRDIDAGTDWRHEIDTHLKTAQIVLLLISADFMASDYCNGIEVKQAMERHASGDTHVLPIILRPVEWKDAPFGALQALPKDSKPITLWVNQDEAFQQVAAGIKTVVENLLVTASLKVAEEHFQRMEYHEAISEFNDIIELRPATILACQGLGKSFSALKQYEKALVAYDQALRLGSKDVTLHQERGNILFELKRYEQALAAYDQALHMNPQDPFGYVGKGYIFLQLHRYQEALAAYEHALRLRPDGPYSFGEKGDALESLRHFKENIMTTIEQLLPPVQLSQQLVSSSSITHQFQRGTFECLHTLKHPHTHDYLADGSPRHSIAVVAMSPDEELVASGGGGDRRVVIYNVKNGQLIQTIRGFAEFYPPNHLLFSSDGQTLFGGAAEKNQSIIKMWDVKNGNLLRTFIADGASEKFETIAMDLDQQLVVGANSKRIAVMDFNTGQKLRKSPKEVSETLDIDYLAVSFAGEVIVSAGFDGTDDILSLWDIQTLRRLHTIVLMTERLKAIAISPDGLNLVSGHSNGLVKLWSLPSGQHIRTFSAHEESITAIAFNFDGQKLITGSYDGTIKIWGEK